MLWPPRESWWYYAIRIVFIIMLISSTVAICGQLPAKAHNSSEIEEWRIEWESKVLVQGGLTLDLMTEYLDFQSRHQPPILLPSSSAPSRTPNMQWSGSIEQWHPLIQSYFQPSDMEWAMRVMNCESRGDPTATNPYSGAAGLFQHIPRYWPERASKAGWAGASIWDPEANIAVAAWLYYSYDEDGNHIGPRHWVCK